MSTRVWLQACNRFIASKFALALSVLRQQNFRFLRSFFRTTLTPAIRRYTCHAFMGAGLFRISRYFVRKLHSISVKIRKNPYTWRLCRVFYWLQDILQLQSDCRTAYLHITSYVQAPPIEVRNSEREVCRAVYGRE